MKAYSNGFALVIARTVDILIAGWIWRDYGVTISSMTGLELRKPQPERWARWLGGALNWLSPGHCESAITADIVRAREALALLHADVVP